MHIATRCSCQGCWRAPNNESLQTIPDLLLPVSFKYFFIYWIYVARKSILNFWLGDHSDYSYQKKKERKINRLNYLTLSWSTRNLNWSLSMGKMITYSQKSISIKILLLLHQWKDKFIKKMPLTVIEKTLSFLFDFLLKGSPGKGLKNSLTRWKEYAQSKLYHTFYAT